MEEEAPTLELRPVLHRYVHEQTNSSGVVHASVGDCNERGGSVAARTGVQGAVCWRVGHDVVWRQSGVTQLVVRCQSEVIQVQWASFPTAKSCVPLRALCALQTTRISVYSADGDSFDVPLPFRAKRMWPLGVKGLLLERDTDLPNEIGGSPCLFTLANPLAEVKPVGIEVDASSDGNPGYNQVSGLTCVHVFAAPAEDCLYCLTNDTAVSGVSLWRLSRPENKWGGSDCGSSLAQGSDFLKRSAPAHSEPVDVDYIMPEWIASLMWKVVCPRGLEAVPDGDSLAVLGSDRVLRWLNLKDGVESDCFAGVMSVTTCKVMGLDVVVAGVKKSSGLMFRKQSVLAHLQWSEPCSNLVYDGDSSRFSLATAPSVPTAGGVELSYYTCGIADRSMSAVVAGMINAINCVENSTVRTNALKRLLLAFHASSFDGGGDTFGWRALRAALLPNTGSEIGEQKTREPVANSGLGSLRFCSAQCRAPAPLKMRKDCMSSSIGVYHVPGLQNMLWTVDNVKTLLPALHYVYEDSKLLVSEQLQASYAAELLAELAAMVGAEDYFFVCCRDFPGCARDKVLSVPPCDDLAAPWDIYAWLRARVRGFDAPLPYKALRAGFFPQTSRAIVLLYSQLCPQPNDSVTPTTDNIEEPDIQQEMWYPSNPLVNEWGKLLDDARKGVSGGNAEENAASRCGVLLVKSMAALGVDERTLDAWRPGVKSLLTATLAAGRQSPPQGWKPGWYSLLGRFDLANPLLPRSPSVLMEGGRAFSNDSSGAGGSLLFVCDRRVTEARLLLDSSTPGKLEGLSAGEAADRLTQMKALWSSCARICALPVGRGGMQLGSISPLPTEPVHVPTLALAAKIPPSDAVLTLDTDELGLSADASSWASFHNGCAAALALHGGGIAVSRQWVVYNKPDSPSYEHAGVLLGLGLAGHLTQLAATDVFSYLTSSQHDPTRAALMLGLAAGRQGSQDPVVRRALQFHVRATHPEIPFDLSLEVEAAAILGLGFLFRGTCHRSTVEVCLASLGRRPVNDQSRGREAFALCSGLAIGLTTLGGASQSIADLRLSERLLVLVRGGSDKRPENGDTGTMNGGIAGCCRVREGPVVNTLVTAPGAIMAYALLHMRTDNVRAANQLSPPSTQFDLERTSPDVSLLLFIGKWLILWGQVEPNEKWVQANVPNLFRSSSGGSFTEDELDFGHGIDREAAQQCTWSAVAGCCFVVGLKYAGTSSSEAARLLTSHLDSFISRRQGAGNLSRSEKRTLETCLGCCAVALGMVMAGSGHVQTMSRFRSLLKSSTGETSFGTYMQISTALGMLFLGGGRASLSTRIESTAALIVSCIPRVHANPGDNEQHLQAARHVYVLAAEQRCLETVEAGSRKPVCVPIEVVLRRTERHAETVLKLMSPTLLPELDRVVRVSVVGNRYWPVVLDVDGCSSLRIALQSGLVLCVQRRCGFMPYLDDPAGTRGLTGRPLPRFVDLESDGAHQQHSDWVSALSGDAGAALIAARACSVEGLSPEERTASHLSAAALYRCMVLDRLRDLPEWNSMISFVQNLAHASPLDAVDAALAIEAGNRDGDSQLFSPSTLAQIRAQVDTSLSSGLKSFASRLPKRSISQGIDFRESVALSWYGFVLPRDRDSLCGACENSVFALPRLAKMFPTMRTSTLKHIIGAIR